MSEQEIRTSDELLDSWAARERRKQEWLAGLKPGDEVALYNGWTHSSSRVTKLTATQIRVGGLKFRREDGHRIGGDRWNRTSLHQMTDEIRDEAEHRKLSSELADVKWKSMSIALLRTVHAMVKAND